MASEVSIRMKLRKADSAKLNEILADDSASELEKKIAQEYLNKMQGATESVTEEAPKKKVAPKKSEAKMVKEDLPENKLTPEEEERLSAAEEMFQERQSKRKTPSKSDRSMKKAEKEEKTVRESKRSNLNESEEVSGLKVGSIVKVGDVEGTVSRIYKSSDGKEKCMVKVADGKPIKKRVTAVEIVK